MGVETSRKHHTWGWVRLPSAVLLAAALVVPHLAQGADTPAPAFRTVADEVPTSTPIRLAQANINKDMSTAKFEADVATVLAQEPDIITYNEVHNRPDATLAPEGYAMFRTPGPRTGWAPVAWKTSAWQAIDQGTVQVSKRPKRFKSGMVGVRYANWVTLTNADQQVISVVSVHVAPNSKDTAELLVPSLVSLQTLTSQLQAQGPVLIGGDFNMGYHGTRYDPSYFQAVGLRSTFDILGTSFPTHRGGGTIDYVFVGPEDRVSVKQHYPVQLRSDHRMVVADLELAPVATALPSFQAETLIVKNTATKQERRVVRRLQLKAIRATQPEAAIHVASSQIQGAEVYKALEEAHERGVVVTVIAGERQLSERAKQLRLLLRNDGNAASWFRWKPKAWRTSASTKVHGRTVAPLRPTVLLISQAGATPAFSLVANATMGRESLKVTYRKRVKANVKVDLGSYDTHYRDYLAHVGKTY
ncbi:MAG: endonuclease/exonuclease/phosphatase family protein [Nocardioides sp.]|uniref:endonuclease/exonuclease/phosphatase family protein n=1 Tax=Nocardioides sp. TaxID=35761 RepID=UPI003F0849F8